MNESERDKDLSFMMKIPGRGPLRRTTFWSCTLRTAVLNHEVQSTNPGREQIWFAQKGDGIHNGLGH